MKQLPLSFAHLSPVALSDCRIYDLLDIKIFEHEEVKHRWTVEMDVQSRCCESIFFFKVLVYADGFSSPPLHSPHCDQWASLADRCRELVADYLRVHPDPSRAYPTGGPILMELE